VVVALAAVLVLLVQQVVLAAAVPVEITMITV
jgi:hypothetical protein